MGENPRETGENLKKYRIEGLVSEEVYSMWQEIIKIDEAKSSKRYYPAHSLSRMIKADYELMKAFGSYK